MSELISNNNFKYKAFISYSHAADEKLAPALQSALHRFAKPFYRLRALHVFRDKTTLQLTDKLWPEIQNALLDSEYFILMASPDAASSIWVRREISEWLNLHNDSTRNLLIVLTDGKIEWDDFSKDFNWKTTTALPDTLKGRFYEEPLYSDLEWAREAEDLSLRNPRFLEEVGSIGARLHNKPRDVMVGQDVRQHRVFKVLTAVVIALLLLLSTVASSTAVYAFRKQKEAEVAAERERESRDRAEQSAQSEREARVAADEQRRIAEVRTEEARQSSQQAKQAALSEQEARKRADEQRIKAEQQRDRADNTAKAAVQATALMVSELATGTRDWVGVSPQIALKILIRAQNALLGTILAASKAEMKIDAGVDRQLGVVYSEIAAIHARLGNYETAMEMIGAARETLETGAEKDPNAENMVSDLFVVLRRESDFYLEQEKYAEALKSVERGEAKMKELRNKISYDFARDELYFLERKAILLDKVGRGSETLAILRRVAKTREDLLGGTPGYKDLIPASGAYLNLSQFCTDPTERLSALTKADELFAKAVEATKMSVPSFVPSFDLFRTGAFIKLSKGDLYLRKGDETLAVESYTKAFELAGEVLNQEQLPVSFADTIARGMLKLSEYYRESGNTKESTRFLKSSADIFGRLARQTKMDRYLEIHSMLEGELRARKAQ